MPSDKNLKHSEVWDDSALLSSWNEAYQEYLKYHSLAAKGEKVKVADLEPQATKPQLNGDASTKSQAQPLQNAAEIDLTSDIEAEQSTAATAVPASTRPAADVPVMPQVLAATVQNEDMKNLMMSWYYAGYYTGLYEGKQQGYASAREELKGG